MKRNTGFDPLTDRYAFDFRSCTPANGWAQMDTRQDASYYGVWINPTTRELVSYSQPIIEAFTRLGFAADLH